MQGAARRRIGQAVNDVILTMKGIDKSFPGVHALDHVDFEVRKGEVHALMGENGCLLYTSPSPRD